MTRDVTAELQALLARNRGPVPGDPMTRAPPRYGIEATLEDECLIRVRLTFKANEHFCCAEASCHLPLHAQGWSALRETLQLSPFVRIVLWVDVIVEGGARFLRLDGTHRFEAYTASRYHVDYSEW